MSHVSKSVVWGWIFVVGCGGASFTTLPDGGGGGPDGGGVDAASDGSTPSDASEAGDARTDAPTTCTPGSIEFVLQVAGGSTQTYCSSGGGGCGSNWLTISTSSGTALSLGNECITDCAQCQPVACPGVCAAPTRVPSAGLQQSWNGTFYDASTCGANVSCVTPDCAAAGNYVARMCAYAEVTPDASFGACVGSTTPTCVDVPFVWPPASAGEVVTGTIGSPAKGACCPQGWSQYDCTWPDGGAGLACHDPAKGCASSTVCGQGCDSVVMGRCDGG